MDVNKVKKGELQMTNKGELSFFFIGAGSAFTKKNFQNNIIIIKGDEHILVDCGTLCSSSLHTIGASITAIRNVFLTHIHADHTGGMEELFLMNRFITKQKPTLYIEEGFQNILWNEALKGGSSYSERREGKYLEMEDFVHVVRPELCHDIDYRETLCTNVGDLQLKFPRTCHIPDSAESWDDAMKSYGVIADDRVFFTSDTMFDRDLVVDFDKHFNFEYIFHDCQLFTGGVHASIEELKTLPPEIKKKMLLMHYGDNRPDFEHLVKEYGFHSWVEPHHMYTF